MEEVIICRICLEPIFNYICVNCLEFSVEKWLSYITPELISSFKQFSEKVKKRFESNFEEENCIKCGEKTETIICPYCYIKEIFDFISTKDENLAKNFIQLFNFDFLKIGHNSESVQTKNLIPVVICEKEESSDLNICENCGNQVDLKEINGSYICEVCEDEFKF